ncbi:MAG: hypothetical protein R3A51_01210 [Nannocystaceae bacterium]|nr:hypothetical protein [Myxococcales bacterium]
MTCLAYYRTIALSLLVAACGPKTNDSDTNAATDTDAATDTNAATDATTTDANTSNATDNASTTPITTTGYDDTTVGSSGTSGYDETFGTETGYGCQAADTANEEGCWYSVVAGDADCCAEATKLSCDSPVICPPVTVCNLCAPGEQIDVDAAVCVLSAMQQRAVATHTVITDADSFSYSYEVLADESVISRFSYDSESICSATESIDALYEPSYYQACIANQDDADALITCVFDIVDISPCVSSPPACG